MNRYLFLPVAAFLLAVPLGAQDPGEPVDEVKNWQRNHRLIQKLVRGGLSLATEDDPLKRADRCNVLAKDLAEEIDQAVRASDTDRVAELGGHFQNLLKIGVAGNLTAVGNRANPSSTAVNEMRRVGMAAAELTDPLVHRIETAETTASRDVRRDLGRVRRAIRKARIDVDNALPIVRQP